MAVDPNTTPEETLDAPETQVTEIETGENDTLESETPKAETPKSDEFKSEASKNAVLADLEKERGQRRALQAELDKLRQQNESEQEKRLREAIEAERSSWTPKFVKQEARAALRDADAKKDRVAELTQFLDLSQIEVKGETVTGLEGQITQLKTKYPEWFTQPKPASAPEPEKKPVPKVPVKNQPVAAPTKTPGQIIAARYGSE